MLTHTRHLASITYGSSHLLIAKTYAALIIIISTSQLRKLSQKEARRLSPNDIVGKPWRCNLNPDILYSKAHVIWCDLTFLFSQEKDWELIKVENDSINHSYLIDCTFILIKLHWYISKYVIGYARDYTIFLELIINSFFLEYCQVTKEFLKEIFQPGLVFFCFWPASITFPDPPVCTLGFCLMLTDASSKRILSFFNHSYCANSYIYIS